MNLKQYVDWKLTHCDKTAEADGYPLVMENCKANKKMKQLELYGNSVQDGTPTPDNPIEVQSVGELTTKNLAKDVKAIYSAKDDYEEISEDNRECVRFTSSKTVTYTGIEFKENTQYTISFDCKVIEKSSNTSTADMGIAIFYTDGTKKGVFGKKDGIWRNLTITSEANKTIESLGIYSYEYRNWVYVDINTFQIEEGTTATPYEPYGKYKIPVVQRGINLFSMGMVNATAKTINGITFTPLDDERIHIKGKAIDTSVYTQCNFTGVNKPLIKGGVYNVKSYTGLQFIIFEVLKYSANEFLMNLNSNTYNANLSQDGYMSRLLIRIPAGDTKEWDDIVPIQLTQGRDTKSLPYEPYIEPVTTNIFLNEPLRKIGDYADYIDFKENKVVRNTFVRVYDGYGKTDNPFNKNDNEANWAGSENHGDKCENFWLYTLNDVLPIIPKSGHHSANDYKQMPICTQLPVKTGYCDSTTADATVDKEMIWFCQQARGVRLYLSKDRLGGTGSNLLTYLRANPISVVIATFEPYEETIECDLPKLKAKTSIIEVDTSILPSNAYGKYIRK